MCRAELYAFRLILATIKLPGPLLICLEIFSSILDHIWHFGFSSEEDAASFTLHCLSCIQTTAVFFLFFFKLPFFRFFSFSSQRRKHFHFRPSRFFLVKAFYFTWRNPPNLHHSWEHDGWQLLFWRPMCEIVLPLVVIKSNCRDFEVWHFIQCVWYKQQLSHWFQNQRNWVDQTWFRDSWQGWRRKSPLLLH